ncbi:MAG: alpha-L-rhamnosidase N-terminal domain-containing protein, partial [Bryobacteraceae bacterium]
WVLAPANTKLRGAKQTAYRVLVAGSEQNLRAGKGDLWDSGRVDSDQSIHVVYGGKNLQSGDQAFWRVEMWDEAGAKSQWSEVARWSMGLLHPDDWKAKWIGRDETQPARDAASPYADLQDAHWIWAGGDGPQVFHSAIAIPAGAKIVNARGVMSGDSGFAVSLNGVELGRDEWVQLPEVLDITHRLRPGANAIAVRATPARRGHPSGLIGSFHVEFASGDPLKLVTSAAWRADSGAVEDLGPYGMEPWGEIGFRENRRLPARMLRKEFAIDRKVKRATVYGSGLGLFELHVNGRKVGDEVLAPGLTDYDKRVQYMTFDVTNLLAPGRNVVGVILG